MPGLRWGEMWVRFLHPLVGVFQGGVAARHPGSQGMVGVDPQPQPLPRRIHVAWVQANALDDDQPLHQLREGAGEDRRDGAAQRMRDHRQRRQAPLTHQLGDVLHVFQVGVGAAEGPLRIPVAAQIGRHHVEAFAQRLRQPVPGMAMVVNAMHQQQIGRGVVAPIEVVKPQALREVAVRRGIVPIRHRRRTWRLRVGGFYPVGACDSPLVEGMLRRSRSQQPSATASKQTLAGSPVRAPRWGGPPRPRLLGCWEVPSRLAWSRRLQWRHQRQARQPLGDGNMRSVVWLAMAWANSCPTVRRRKWA